MKIALIAYEFPPRIGGMETYAFEIARRLRRRHDVTVVCRVQHDSFNYKKLGLNLKILPVLTGVVEADVRSVEDFLKERPQDIIHLLNAGFAVAAKRLERSATVVVTANGKDFLKPWIAPKAAVRAGLKSAGRILAVSEFARKRLLKSGIRKNIAVVHHGTDTMLFRPAGKDKSLVKKLGIKGEKIILTASRVARKKNIEGVISMLPELKGARYLVAGPIGEKEYFEELKALAKKLGVMKRVTFTGPIRYEALPKYYNLCDVYVMLSVEHGKGDIESFGIAYLEAMACGKPVIASTASGMAGIIRKEKAGFALSPDGSKNTAAKIRAILGNPAKLKRMGAAGMKLVRKKYSWDIAANRISRLYADAVKKKKQHRWSQA